jgi:hypothetical protein
MGDFLRLGETGPATGHLWVLLRESFDIRQKSISDQLCVGWTVGAGLAPARVSTVVFWKTPDISATGAFYEKA